MTQLIGQARRWLRHNRRNLAVALVTFTFTVLILMTLSMVSGVRFEPSHAGGSADALGGLDSMGNEVTAEERDYFSRASPLEQAQLLRDRQEKAITEGAKCSGKPC